MDPVAELLGECPALVALRRQVRGLLDRQASARRFPPILIQGETGTGKGLLAQVLHRSSPRRAAPFVDINCAAIPETLLEAELFGFERGAFTDARQAKAGLFQSAHGGTIFLDEVALLPESLQGKLLKAIEERAVRRLGSTRSESVDVWVIAAASEDLTRPVRERRFRADLYHRLAVIVLTLPPLRERGADVLVLAEHFLTSACDEYGLPPKSLGPEARAFLRSYPWPGNVRELHNAIERAVLLSERAVVAGADLGLAAPPPGEAPPERESGRAGPLDDAIRGHLVAVLDETGWNVSQAALRLGIARNTLRARIDKYGLAREQVASLRTAGPPRAGVSTSSVSPPPPTTRDETVQWERRCLAFLWAEMVTDDEEEQSLASSWPIELLAQKVGSFGGRVEELGPRGIVAAFGLEASGDAPRRAANAALAIRRAVVRRHRLPHTESWVRAALDVDEVLVGTLGTQIQIDLEAKSRAWTALRALTEASAPGSIVATTAAARFLERRFSLAEIGQVGGGRAYRVLGGEERRFRPTPFVGRVDESQSLRDALARARDGHGQVVAVVGEPGVGKSRLVWEIARAARLEGWRVLEGQCVPHGHTFPYLPIVDLLRAYFGLEEYQAAASLRERITSRLRELDPGLEGSAPPLSALLDVTFDDPEWARLDPRERRRRTLDACRLLLLGLSRVEPLIVVVEDLQWADSETQAVLDRLVEGIPTARLALVVVCRAEHSPRWVGGTYYTQVRLDPLSPESTEALLDALLGHDPGLRPLEKLLVERTGGNPFFIEESVRALVESGVLGGEGGAYRLTKDPEAVDLSPSVRAVLADRIDRLGIEEKRLLQAAAVIGKDVDYALLSAVADLPEDALRRGLAQLRAADLLYEARVVPAPEYAFKHALTQEVTYATLLPERRTASHARVVEAIETLYADRLAEHVDRLAHHALRGALWEKAVRYFRQAAMSALSRSAYREAVSCLDHAIEAVSRLPERPERLDEAVDLRLELRTPLVAIDDHPRFGERLREAEAMVVRTGDRRRHCRVLACMCHTSFLSGELQRAIALGEQAAAIASDLGDPQLLVAVDYPLAQVYYTGGELARALDLFREIAAITGATSSTGLAGLEAAGCRAYLTYVLASLGRFSGAFENGRAALEIASSTGRHYDLVIARAGLGFAHNSKGEFDAAIAVLAPAVELARTSELAAWHSSTLSALGVAYMFSRPDDAVRVLSESVELDHRRRVMSGHSIRLSYLGYAHFWAGRPAQGLRILDQALDRARSQRERTYEARVLHARGDILANMDRVEEALATYRQGLDLATALGTRPVVAHCHLGLGKLHRRQGELDAAREHLATALAMYREMDMRFWPEQAEAELRAVA